MDSQRYITKLPPQMILIVDDEPQVCQMLAEALTHLGYMVDTAKDGMEAMAKLELAQFTIVITDMDMPGIDGMELIRHLVQDSSNIDIIAITGHTMRYKYTDVIAAGADDFITKPFTLDELEAKLNRLHREKYLREELERLAIRDHLTGLYNRRFFQKIVRREAVRALRHQHPLFLFFIDIDWFKNYNDLKGHQAGDALLVRFGDVLKSSIREHIDTAFRFGGDEFTVLLPYLTRDQANAVAKRILNNYNKLSMSPTSLSIGAAQFNDFRGNIEKDIEEMILRADNALYRAKHHLSGNTVSFDGDSMLLTSLR